MMKMIHPAMMVVRRPNHYVTRESATSYLSLNERKREQRFLVCGNLSAGDTRGQFTYVSEISSDDSSEESTSRENGRNEGLLPGGESECSYLGSAGVWARNRNTGEEADEVIHSHDSGNITRIVAKEDTTERGEDAHEVRLHGDGSLNTADIGRGGQVNISETTTRHGCRVCSSAGIGAKACKTELFGIWGRLAGVETSWMCSVEMGVDGVDRAVLP